MKTETKTESSAPPSRRMDGKLETVTLDKIQPSKTNPRKQFETDDWLEFVESIRTHGVIQPPLVRPLESGKVELVSGERRYRAAKEVKLEKIQVLIREIGDAEAVELQQIENLQREDVSALEEAQGYEDWCQALMKTGLTKEKAVEHVADKISRKRALVYGRLALLKTSPAVQRELSEGNLDLSKAQLIAQVPDPAKQRELLGQTASSNGREGISVQELKGEIERRYRVCLKTAHFNQADATLVPKAGVCADCPKRTGNMKEKFPDIGADNFCTDPACFNAKARAHGKRLMEAAKKNGQQVLEPGQADNIVDRDGDIKYGRPFISLNARCEPKGWEYKNHWKAALGKHMPPPILAVTSDGKVHEVLKKNTAIEALKKTGWKPRSEFSGGNAAYRRQDQERKEQRALIRKTDAILRPQLLSAVKKSKLSTAFWQWLIIALIKDGNDVLVRRGVIKTDNCYSVKTEEKHVRKIKAEDELRMLLVDAIAGREPEDWQTPDFGYAFKTACELFKINYKKNLADVKAAAAEAKKAKKAKKPKSTAATMKGGK